MTTVARQMIPQPINAWVRVRATIAHTHMATSEGTNMKIDGHRTSVLMSSSRAENDSVTSQK